MPERLGIRVCLAGLEEHVLVHVREPFVFGALRERAVLHVQFDGCNRNAVVFDGNHFQSIPEHGALDHAFELGTLCQER